jgi:hypothetical protein
MKSQSFIDRLIKKLVSCMKRRISNSFMAKVSGRKGRGFPFICLEHGIKAGRHCSSRDWFAAALTAKYGGLKFHDINGPIIDSMRLSMVLLLRTTAVYFGN